MSRRQEVKNISPGQEPEWLAGQMDEMEVAFVAQMTALTKEIGALRRVLTGILVGIIIALVSVPIGILWASAVHVP